jgi:hypothetical protein
MVTNNKSHWEELNELATRCVTLGDGQIKEDKIIGNREAEVGQVETNKQESNASTTQTHNWISMLLNQIWAELVQLS